MKKKKGKKALRLNKEVIRKLTKSDLDKAAGGLAKDDSVLICNDSKIPCGTATLPPSVPWSSCNSCPHC